MKKITLFAVFALLALLTVSSCKDDDKEKKNDQAELIGAWKTNQHQLYFDDEPLPNTMVVSYMWYKADGTFVEADVITGENTTYTELSEHGKWKVSGNKLTQTTKFDEDDTDFDEIVMKYKVSGNTLTVTYQIDGGEEESEQLQRISEVQMQEIIDSAKKVK